MLTPDTLQHLARYTCPVCGDPLGRFHCYPILSPETALSLCVESGPMHLSCAKDTAHAALLQQHTEGRLSVTRPALSVVAVVKGSPRSPSARMIRLHPEDAETACLALFTPHRLHFDHVTFSGTEPPVSAERRATNREVFLWLEDAITEAMHRAPAGSDERHELTLHLGRLQTWIPKTPR